MDWRYRVDLTVLPILFVGLLVFQLDRMNIASALTGGFAIDIKVDQSTINLGNQLMFMSIVVLEIPSNILLQRVSKSASAVYEHVTDEQILSCSLEQGSGLLVRFWPLVSFHHSRCLLKTAPAS